MKSLTRLILCGTTWFITTGLAEAKTPDPNVIYGCVTDIARFVRIVKAPKDCLREEKLVEWNIVGPSGPIGPQGLPGLQGPLGPQGLPGAKGAPGVAGPAGPQGLAGAAGPAGPKGVAGPAGPKGTTGQAGINGPAGPAGPAGPQGFTGTSGPSGPIGPAGPAGPQGAPGTTTLPANLQTLSTILTRVSSQNGGTNFADGNGGTCTIGDILLSTNNYNLGNYVPADGTLYIINTHTAQFSILGTRFGGDGLTNFAVPNIQAIAPSGMFYSICFFGVFPSRN